jgi:hypothetical protein
MAFLQLVVELHSLAEQLRQQVFLLTQQELQVLLQVLPQLILARECLPLQL